MGANVRWNVKRVLVLLVCGCRELLEHHRDNKLE